MDDNKENIINLLNKISEYNKKYSGENKAGYYQDKRTIHELFKSTQDKIDESKIRIRLTVLDSMYSTQMRMHPYGSEDLTNAIWEKCYKDNRTGIKDTLIAIAAGKEPDSRDKADEIYNLFRGKYGVEANNAQAVSLISKYFYFETDYKFPIYDSIVREYLPILYEYCGNEQRKAIPANDIKQYIETINCFFGIIKYTTDELRYDSLDHLLWDVGKIIRGNLSLVLNKGQYEDIMKDKNYKIFEEKIKSNNYIGDVYEAYINTFKKVAGKEVLLSDFADIASAFIEIKLSKKPKSTPEINGD